MKRVGILGLPRSGKTTLFEILLQGAGAGAAAGRDHIGVVRVPDERVERLSALFQPKKTTHAQIQFLDSAAAGHAGARAAAKGPDLFSAVRTSDALLLVVRDFESPTVPREGGRDAERDRRDLEAELILNDLAIVENRREKLARELKVGKRQGEAEHALLERCEAWLQSERPLRTLPHAAEEEKVLRGFQLLTLKPLLVVYNQDDADDRAPPDAGPGALAIGLRAHLEREIVALPAEERAAFRAELGVAEDGLTLVIRACYRLLGLRSFFTVGPDEVRAWTVRQGATAVEAAGEIHTDFEKGFIRAEVVSCAHLLECGGYARAREKGHVRLEGRDYVVEDGDVLEIRFNR